MKHFVFLMGLSSIFPLRDVGATVGHADRFEPCSRIFGHKLRQQAKHIAASPFVRYTAGPASSLTMLGFVIAGLQNYATFQKEEKLLLDSKHYQIIKCPPGTQLLPFGICLSLENIRKVLSEEEKKVYDHGIENPVELAKLLSQKLYGDYQYSLTGDDGPLSSENFMGADASKFFVGQACFRGVCRNKSTILNAILTGLGIRSEYHVGSSSRAVHAWVYLPDWDMVFDSTKNIVLDRESYLKQEGYTDLGPVQLKVLRVYLPSKQWKYEFDESAKSWRLSKPPI